MAVRREAAALLKSGLSPIEVAETMKKQCNDLRRLLLLQVGESELRLADTYFSISSERREIYEAVDRRIYRYYSKIQSVRARRFPTGARAEFELYLICRDAPRGDLYVGIADIEVTLHTQIETVLKSQFGNNDDSWWRTGVPLQIRKRCVTTKEEDDDPMEHPFSYTTLIDLWDIIEKNWAVFVKALPKETAGEKRKLGQDLRELNKLRNCVMHPVTNVEFETKDLDFVTGLREVLSVAKWRGIGVVTDDPKAPIGD